MGLASDLKILYHLALKPVRGKDHAARMESFYSGQAEAYDDFRKRLLKGRQELWNLIQPPEGGTWIDMGGGTGGNLEYFQDVGWDKAADAQRSAAAGPPPSAADGGPTLQKLRKVYVLDLSHSLLEVAKKRIAAKGWTNVETVEADATTFQPPDGPVDVVTFSYSLTMIPDWFAAIENALAMLKPGGQIGVVDFYVSRKFPQDGLKQHGWSTRSFWPTWFAMDNVFPSPDHVPFLHRHFEVLAFEEHRAKVPYVPFSRVPYYLFVGRKRS
ncbi:MAG TPA: class I SAM-dependent methyltransferase [Pirellulaceae bacterium]|nr:class I SAM-dependent methyltransferase [Pirellulaceae bacterium]